MESLAKEQNNNINVNSDMHSRSTLLSYSWCPVQSQNFPLCERGWKKPKILSLWEEQKRYCCFTQRKQYRVLRIFTLLEEASNKELMVVFWFDCIV